MLFLQYMWFLITDFRWHQRVANPKKRGATRPIHGGDYDAGVEKMPPSPVPSPMYRAIFDGMMRSSRMLRTMEVRTSARYALSARKDGKEDLETASRSNDDMHGDDARC